jgi:hypothetical protein
MSRLRVRQNARQQAVSDPLSAGISLVSPMTIAYKSRADAVPEIL